MDRQGQAVGLACDSLDDPLWMRYSPFRKAKGKLAVRNAVLTPVPVRSSPDFYSSLASFAAGLQRDLTAVQVDCSSCWSQGQAEGQVNRLKLLKRYMYDQADLPLVHSRLLSTLYHIRSNSRESADYQEHRQVGGLSPWHRGD